MKKLVFGVLAVAAVLTACGAGEETTSAQMPLAAEGAAQPPQAAVTWSLRGDGLMEWAEATYPQHFPAGPLNRTSSPYTYRYYPQTGNYLAVTSDSIYIHGPVAGGRLTRVASLTDFACQVNPLYCVPAAAPVVLPPATGGTTPSGAALPGVTAVLNSPRRIDAEIPLGQRLSGTTLSGSAVGNIAALSGRTLYIIVEDPHSLYQNPPSVSVFSTSVSVAMTGRTPAAAGLMEGNLKVHVCLDPQCAAVLGGSPLLVPYRVLVTPGVSTDQESLVVYAGFGEPAATRTINIALPQNTTSWSALLTGNGGAARINARSSSQRGNIAGSAVLTFPPAPAGVYSDTLRIAGTITSPATGALYNFSKDIPVTYQVNPNTVVDAVIYPVETQVVRAYGDSSGPSYPRTALANTGVTLASRGIEYLAATPAAGASSAPLGNAATSWWSETTQSPTVCQGSNCLPAGTYTARVRYTITKGGVSSDIYHPVTMRIYP